jgi:FixJ family two-component response regulator
MGTTPAARTVHVVNADPDVRRSFERLLLAAGFAPVLYATAFCLSSVSARLTVSTERSR